jgi:hypothetical protein
VLLRNSPDRAIMLASAHAMVRPPAAIFANRGVKKRVASGEKSPFSEPFEPYAKTSHQDPAERNLRQRLGGMSMQLQCLAVTA